MLPSPVVQLLHKYQDIFHPVVNFSPEKDRLLLMDFSANNATLTESIYNNTEKFCQYINNQLQRGYRYGIGGYNELRVIYAASSHFDAGEEPRRLHLGIDIWAEAGTPVFAFMGGSVHSVAYNSAKGDYGATLILLHQLDGFAFYTLYGHISLSDIQDCLPGQYVVRGETIAHLGEPSENGDWPPHLHFQLILNMELKEGDYPGVCKFSEREKYLQNCPDPDLILQLMQYTKQ
ncbi:MAG: peptidoglycan DD-metalloendopeptidase family protein [Chitinophagaceae bacterium]